MKLNELTTEYEQHKVFMYASDGNKVVRHNKKMCKIADNIYVGEPESDGWEDVSQIYLVFDGIACGINVDREPVRHEVDDVVSSVTRCGIDTVDGIINTITRLIGNSDHIPMLYVEFVRQIKPDMVPAMMESRRLYAERIGRKAKEAKAKQEAEDAEYVRQKNEIADRIVNKAIEILRNGGILNNDDVVIYKSRYDSNTYSVVNYLCRKYGVKLPLRTAGWVNDCLANLQIENDKCENLQYYKRTKNTTASNAIYGYINQLIAAVKAA